MEHLYVYFYIYFHVNLELQNSPIPFMENSYQIIHEIQLLLTSQPATLHPISVGEKSDFIFLVLLNEFICVPCLR